MFQSCSFMLLNFYNLGFCLNGLLQVPTVSPGLKRCHSPKFHAFHALLRDSKSSGKARVEKANGKGEKILDAGRVD